MKSTVFLVLFELFISNISNIWKYLFSNLNFISLQLNLHFTQNKKECDKKLKAENPLTGKPIDVFNWKTWVAIIGGIIILIVAWKAGGWIVNKVSGFVGMGTTTQGSGSTLNDVLGGI